jgi:ubiquinone biosynthesis protein
MLRILALREIYRHGARWAEILSVFSKYGLADWIDRLGLEVARDLIKGPTGEAVARLPWTTRIRMALTELGPTFIKLGQLLSTRPDVVGVALARELEELQEHVAADPPEVVRQIIVQELGRPAEEVFDEFHDEPLASASIGQVHRARLKTGEDVVVKVQHPAIEEKLIVDLEILNGLAFLAERIPDFQIYRPLAVVAELRRTLVREIDFVRELRNLQEFRSNFESSPDVRIPRAFPELSTKRILVLEYLDGMKLTEPERLKELAIDFNEVARRGALAYLKMIFEDGLYHADPHPGNIMVFPDGSIGLLDFGMVGRLDDRLKERVQELITALVGQDSEHLSIIVSEVGAAPISLDRAALALDLADFVAYYGHMPVEQFDLGGALNEMIEILRRYRIVLPARIALLLKTLIVLEGTAQLLSPRFHLLEVIRQYRKKILWHTFSPREAVRRARRTYWEFQSLLEIMPQAVRDLVQQLRHGTFDIHLDHRGLEPSVNRLVVGLMTSALFLGSALMMAHRVPPLIGDLPLIGLWFGENIRTISALGFLGITLSAVWGWRVWRAIRRSGKLDRH